MAYFEDRLAEQLLKLLDTSTEVVEKELARYYKAASKEISKEYERLYLHIQQKLVDGKEIQPLRIYQFDKYYQIQREIAEKLKELGNQEIAAITKEMTQMYKKTYLSLPIGQHYKSDDMFSLLLDSKAKTVLESIWCADGKHWSSRIWDKNALLQQRLEEGLVDIVLRGGKSIDLTRMIQQEFNVSFRQADRLVRTETAHLQTVAAHDRYKDAGIEEVEVIVESDACDDCLDMRDKKFSIDKSISLVPKHPNCRCCVVPVIKHYKDLPFY